QSIYGHRGVTEFLAVSASRGLAIRIECKWQQSQGSVDEKFPYLYLNCIQAMPEREIILLIDGNGYKPGALAWLKQAVASQDAKLIHVFNLVEFLVWANRRLRQK
ncbi:PD-(D/E)XK nuclease superfamily protein, partial [Bilophila wadsworthia]